MKYDDDFWKAIDTLVSTGKIVIDRPKGSLHPRFSNIKYEVDSGYIENTTSMDGGGIDIWVGSLAEKKVNAIICTVDLMKKDDMELDQLALEMELPINENSVYKTVMREVRWL